MDFGSSNSTHSTESNNSQWEKSLSKMFGALCYRYINISIEVSIVYSSYHTIVNLCNEDIASHCRERKACVYFSAGWCML